MSALLGMRDVESVVAEARPTDYSAKVLKYWRTHVPFIAMLRTLKRRRKPTDPKVTLFQTDLPELSGYAAAEYAAGLGAITVDDGAGNGMARRFRKGDTILVAGATPNLSTGEMLVVTENPADETTLAVARGQFGTTAATIANNSVLIRMGDGHPEGGDSPTPVWDEPTSLFNYVEAFRDSWLLTSQMGWTETRYDEKEDARLADRALVQHALKQELAVLYGQRGTRTDPTLGTQIRKMGGFTYFLPAGQKHDGSSTNFTAANIKSWLGGLTYGSQEKIGLIGKTAYQAVQTYAAGLGTIEIPVDKESVDMGFRLRRLRTDGPDILFVVHPLLTKYAPGDLLVVDMAYCEELAVQDMVRKAVPQSNTTDRIKKQWESDRSVLYGNPLAHCYIQGITTFTAAA